MTRKRFSAICAYITASTITTQNMNEKKKPLEIKGESGKTRVRVVDGQLVRELISKGLVDKFYSSVVYGQIFLDCLEQLGDASVFRMTAKQDVKKVVQYLNDQTSSIFMNCKNSKVVTDIFDLQLLALNKFETLSSVEKAKLLACWDEIDLKGILSAIPDSAIDKTMSPVREVIDGDIAKHDIEEVTKQL